MAVRENGALFLVTSLSVLILVPFAEEILFRGYLQTWIKQKLGRFWTIGLTSLVFALFHYAERQGIRNIQFVGVLFIFSCFLGFIKERQQSIWAPFGLHLAFNSIALAAIYLKV
nr:CPBP family intramembrane glutamic endopeptidase [Parachlamydia sp. AcF125]